MNDKPTLNENNPFFLMLESSGMKFLNQLKKQSFSLNTFQMNALDLMEATLRVHDPDHGLYLMSQGQRDAGHQAHRELSRHIHNFVASAKTLVDHTRVFMEEHYAETETLEKYKAQVIYVFGSDPVSKFVHDLRNYMLHKGMPNTQMYLNMGQDPSKSDQGATLDTGIRIDTVSLLEWRRWTAPAKEYIKRNGKFIYIHGFVGEYLTRVERFHEWLEFLLREHHASDLAELERLQHLNALRDSSLEGSSDFLKVSNNSNDAETSPTEVFDCSIEEKNAINEVCESLFLKVGEILLPDSATESFPTERPVTATITDKEIIGSPKYFGQDINGDEIFAFIFREGKIFGYKLPELMELESVCDRIQNISWVQDNLTRDFIKDEFLCWVQANFLEVQKPLFSDVFISSSRNSIATLEVWAPIAYLEVQSAFEFGPVNIVPISSEMVDALENKSNGAPPEQKQSIQQFFDRLREELQGLAAVVVNLKAEPRKAYERMLITAQDAVNLLRFFSPGAHEATVLCPITPMGQEIIPKSKIIAFSDKTFALYESVLADRTCYWRLSEEGLEKVEKIGLSLAGELVNPIGLNEFSTAIRTGIIKYSKGMTFSSLSDRLSHTLSAIEQILLKHEIEPIKSIIAQRISCLLTKDEIQRALIAKNIRQVYWLRDQPRATPFTSHEQMIISEFIACAYQALLTALMNLKNFHSRTEFIEAIEN